MYFAIKNFSILCTKCKMRLHMAYKNNKQQSTVRDAEGKIQQTENEPNDVEVWVFCYYFGARCCILLH